MPGEQISPEVKQFIQSAINSVDQLEVLLFMVSNPDRDWTADEVSDRVRLTRDVAASKLEDLAQAQLIGVKTGSPKRYCYAPSPALAQEVAESLDRAYREGKDTVIQLIYSRPLDNIRIFADAFRIRRND